MSMQCVHHTMRTTSSLLVLPGIALVVADDMKWSLVVPVLWTAPRVSVWHTMWVHEYTILSIFQCMFVCVCAYVCVCCVHVCVCAYVCMHVCMYVHTGPRQNWLFPWSDRRNSSDQASSQRPTPPEYITHIYRYQLDLPHAAHVPSLPMYPHFSHPMYPHTSLLTFYTPSHHMYPQARFTITMIAQLSTIE